MSMKWLMLTILIELISVAALAEEPRTNILAILPLTGAEARQGELARRGAELGAAGFPQLKITYEDSQTEPRVALSAYRKAKASGPLAAVLTCGSPSAMALAPVINQDRIYLFSIAANPAYSSPDDFTYRIIGSAVQEAEYLAEVVTKVLMKKRVAIIFGENDYGLGTAQSFKKALPPNVLVVAEESFLPGSSDFRTMLLRLKAKQPDLLYIASWARDAATMLVQARDIGFVRPTLCSQACSNPDLLTASHGAAEGMLITVPTEEMDSAALQKYRQQYKEEPTFVVTRMYLIVQRLGTIITECESEQISQEACFKRQLLLKRSNQQFTFEFDSSGDFPEKYQLKEVRDNEFANFSR